MAAPEYVPVKSTDRARAYESPDYVPGPWLADRPGDLDGRQPEGHARRRRLPGTRDGLQRIAPRAGEIAPRLLVPAEEPVEIVARHGALVLGEAGEAVGWKGPEDGVAHGGVEGGLGRYWGGGAVGFWFVFVFFSVAVGVFAG